MAIAIQATIKAFNYRCFGGAGPCVLEIRPGFIGYVGPNNSGKSTILRLLREFKPLFAMLGDEGQLTALARGMAVGVGLADIEDQSEIATDLNNGPVTIEIALPNQPDDQLSTVRLEYSRSNGNWTGKLYRGPNFAPIESEHPHAPLTFSNGAGGRTGLSRTGFNELTSLINRSVYFPPFRHAISGAAGTTLGDLAVGAEFITTWAQWQTGPSKTQRQRIRRVEADIARLFSFESFSAQAAVGNASLQVSVNGRDYRLREMGSGLIQFLLALGTAAIRDPTIILIDEPELNLHPSLQQDFLTALAGYATYGVIFATHSLGLARSCADLLFSVQSAKTGSRVSPWEATANVQQLLGELSYSAYVEMGVTQILCVEGKHDIRTLRQLLRLMRLEHTTLLLELGGHQSVSEGTLELLRDIQRAGAPVAVVLDSERVSSTGEPDPRRKQLASTCEAIGVPVHLTELRAMENYFTDAAIKAALGQRFSKLDPYQALRDCQLPWSKSDNWRIAREMTLKDLESSDVHAFLQTLLAPTLPTAS